MVYFGDLFYYLSNAGFYVMIIIAIALISFGVFSLIRYRNILSFGIIIPGILILLVELFLGSFLAVMIINIIFMVLIAFFLAGLLLSYPSN